LADSFCERQATGNSLIDGAVELTERAGAREEALFLLTNLVRQGSTTVVGMCIDKNVVPVLVEALYLEDTSLSEAVICGLARVFTCEENLATRSSAREQFRRASGDEVLELLIAGESVEVARLAQAFRNHFDEQLQGIPPPFTL
jgi:hypothetical protein